MAILLKGQLKIEIIYIFCNCFIPVLIQILPVLKLLYRGQAAVRIRSGTEDPSQWLQWQPWSTNTRAKLPKGTPVRYFLHLKIFMSYLWQYTSMNPLYRDMCKTHFKLYFCRMWKEGCSIVVSPSPVWYSAGMRRLGLTWLCTPLHQ